MDAYSENRTHCPVCGSPQAHREVCANCVLRNLEYRQKADAAVKRALFQVVLVAGTTFGVCLQVLKTDWNVALIASAVLALVTFTLTASSAVPLFRADDRAAPRREDVLAQMPPTPEGQAVNSVCKTAVLIGIAYFVYLAIFHRR